MAVYVDDLMAVLPNAKWRWDRACHLIADTPAELHHFAGNLGLRRQWFQADSVLPHYDLTAGKRLAALKLGAEQIGRREFVARLREFREVLQRGGRRPGWDEPAAAAEREGTRSHAQDGREIRVGDIVVGFECAYVQPGSRDYVAVIEKHEGMEIGGTTIAIAHQDLPANTIWHYVRRQVTDCGLESADSDPCVVVIGAAGSSTGSAPRAPYNLVASLQPAGAIRLDWRYSGTDSPRTPTGFRVYQDSGSGFDFDTPAATVTPRVPLTRGTHDQAWVSGALSHGQRYRFCVRSYCATGESQNCDSVSIVADAVGPAAITDLRGSWVEV